MVQKINSQLGRIDPYGEALLNLQLAHFEGTPEDCSSLRSKITPHTKAFVSEGRMIVEGIKNILQRIPAGQ